MALIAKCLILGPDSVSSIVAVDGLAESMQQNSVAEYVPHSDAAKFSASINSLAEEKFDVA